jgi:hypothetical protein
LIIVAIFVVIGAVTVFLGRSVAPSSMRLIGDSSKPFPTNGMTPSGNLQVPKTGTYSRQPPNAMLLNTEATEQAA